VGLIVAIYASGDEPINVAAQGNSGAMQRLSWKGLLCGREEQAALGEFRGGRVTRTET